VRTTAATFIGVLLVTGAGIVAAAGPIPQDKNLQVVEQSLELLQESSREWLTKASCASCHHQVLEEMAVNKARRQGISIDETLVILQRARIEQTLSEAQPKMLEIIGSHQRTQVGPNPEMIFGYMLLGLAETARKPDLLTANTVRYLLLLQEKGGNWRSRVKQRPPLEASDFTATALAIRAISAFRPGGQENTSEQAISRATRWLLATNSADTEDSVFRLFGLHWAHAERRQIKAVGRDLLLQQRADGGWSQTVTGESDAYATGQSLVALREARILRSDAPEHRKAIAFLMRTQEPDGSWHVSTRAQPIQKYFETGFPHGKDQFISYAATCWATMAILNDDGAHRSMAAAFKSRH